MFWKFAPSSNIDSLLDKEDITLREVLNEEEVLQECKGQNTKLIDFLCKKENIEDLVDMVTLEPPEDENEAVRYKFPSLACELLISDVTQINDALGESEVVRKKLFSFLDREPPVNSLLASFFSKVVGILLSRKPEPTLEYIKSQDDFLASVLKHLGTSAIMDLLLRMVTCVEAADLRAQVLSWLNENQLVQRLIGLIDPEYDEELHCNSAQSLCDIIRLSREHMYTMQESAQDDPLLNTLEREETVSLLLHHMFDGELVESVIVNGISILLALLEIRRPAPFGFPEAAPELTQLDVERLARGVSRTLHGVSGRLTDFRNLLINPPKKEIMKCTFGDLDPPLGNTRLHVGKLLSAILMTNTHNINSQLADLRIFDSLLDLFFKYEYNNFLHTQVSGCIQTVLSNAANVPTHSSPVKTETNSNQDDSDSQKNEEEEESETENPRVVAPLLAHIFEECRIIQRIMDAWEDNHRHENDDGGHRKGNMGHLTNITNCIVEGLEKGVNCERLKRFLGEMPEEDQGRWQKFVAEALSEMNEKNSRELGGHNPMHFSSDEDNDEFRDVPFNTDSSLQQAYTDYQLQQMTSNFIDQFGFTDEDFAEPDDNIKFDKIESIDFDIKGDTNMPSAQLFEAVCKARVAHLDDNFDDEDEEHSNKSDDDIWDERPISFADDVRGSPTSKTISTTPTVTVRHRSDSGSSTGSSDSSNESPVGSPLPNAIKIPDAEERMDTSQSPGWKADFDFGSGSSNEKNLESSPRVESSVPDKKVSDGDHMMDVGQDSKVDEIVISSSANTANENWADFEKFNSNTVDVVSSSASSEQPVSSQEQTSASSYSAADSTSKDTNLEDLDAGSPMAVTYQHSPGEATESASVADADSVQTSAETEAVSSSNEQQQQTYQRQSDQDIVMDDVSSTPNYQTTQTIAQSSTLPKSEESSGGDDNVPSSSHSDAPAQSEDQRTSEVAMDTEPSSTDESEVKRQRIEMQENQRTQEADTSSSGVDDQRTEESTITVTSSDGGENVSDVADREQGSVSAADTEISSSDNNATESTDPTPATESLVQQSAVSDTSDAADAASSGDDDRLITETNPVPDTSTDPNASATHFGVVSQSDSSESTGSPLKQGLSDYVQHNEVSSSSVVDAKLSNAVSSEDTRESSAVNPPSEIKMNGPA
uniref:serine/threonine-protein phosphatase 6 regulatory subunit 3-like isoform X1 n=1 Tax=Styela clava TaxID=7725 RepID=UPI00193A3CEE|nr:serine/threonine-protein phosphatase 6 regulatory subunit 3-like isoform X1 [Styela clava]